MATIDVYSNSEEVELFINEVSVGRQAVNGFIADFCVSYRPGTLTAVSFDKGKETGRHTLISSDRVAVLDVSADKRLLKADGMDLAYVTIQLTDQEGNVNLFEKKNVSISIDGPASLQGFGSADPSSEGNYQNNTCMTYDGKVMAVVRAGTEAGDVYITVHADDCDKKTVSIGLLEHEHE